RGGRSRTAAHGGDGQAVPRCHEGQPASDRRSRRNVLRIRARRSVADSGRGRSARGGPPRGLAVPATPRKQQAHKGAEAVSTIRTKDGTSIYYKDWGTGPVVTFSHGWPLSSDMWDGQMLFLAQNGCRVIAHDRRGHGRSDQASTRNDMDGYADDLAELITALDVRDVTVVGHSTGGGEVARYIGRHGTARVAKAVLIAAVPPIMLKTEANPEGLPIEAFNAIRAGLVKDRSQYYRELAPQFYGANRPGST